MLTLKLLVLIFVNISATITFENETSSNLPQWQELECEVIDEIHEKLNLKTFHFQPGHKYLFSETTLPWLEAKDECELYGGWLVDIRSQGEANCLMRYGMTLGVCRHYWTELADNLSSGH